MADLKISQLPPLVQADLAANDLLAIVDTSGTATKKITPTELVDGSIDLLSTGAIPVVKLAYGTARQLLQTNAAGTATEWTSNVDIPGTLDVWGAAVFNSTVSIIAGSESSPGLFVSGDTNTGIYFPGADQFAISTGGTGRLFVDSSGRLLVGTSSDSGGALLQVNGDRVRIATAKTPASASDTGTTGEVCWDANYIYVCTATDTWKRAALSTW